MTDNTEAGGGADDGDNGQDGDDIQDERRATAQAASAQAYDPLRQYDPRREFGDIETERAKIDERLLSITGPFALAVVFLVRISAFAVVWAAGIVPILETVRYFGLSLSPLMRCIVIVGIPGLALLAVAGWLLVRLPILLRWAAVHIEMYLDDEVSNKLIQEGLGNTGELKGIHIGSNTALLGLLRLRMKAFHFWHRISIHTFILNGIFFRGKLETPFVSPRLWANGVPVLAVVIFLSVQLGLFFGNGGPAVLSPEVAQAFLGQVWRAIISARVGGVPVILPMLSSFALAFWAYYLARRARFRIIDKLNPFLNTEHFLTPHTHDYSRNILAKHERLIRIMAKLWARGGRNDHGGTSDDTLWGLILDDGMDPV